MDNAGDYTRITVATADALNALGGADVSVYLPNASESDVVLYRKAGSSLARPDFRRLGEHGLSTVFIRTGEMRNIEDRLEDRLAHLLHSSQVPAVAKAELAHQVGSAIAREMTNDQSSPVDLGRAAQFVDEIVNCTLAHQEVSPYLAHMAAHHRSTASHMVIVSALAVALGAEVFGKDRQRLRDLGMAGLLHDLGKLSIGRNVLDKPGKLSPEEENVIRQHPVESVRLLGDDPIVTPAVRRMILQHHERYDGHGYPLGLSGGEIEHGSKVLALVDMFHAITGPRAYRAALTPLEASRVLNTLSGRQFDPEVLAGWNQLFARLGTKPPEAWAVQANELGDDETGNRHEHRPGHREGEEIRHRAPRHPCHHETSVACQYAGRLPGVFDVPEQFAAKLRDVSRYGIGLTLGYPVFRGEVLHISMTLRSQPVDVEGVVAWCRRARDEDLFHCGIALSTRLTATQVGRPVPVVGLRPSLALAG